MRLAGTVTAYSLPKSPARASDFLNIYRGQMSIQKWGLCRYALNESKHNVRRLEFSAGLGGLPPNQIMQNRTRTKNRHKPGKTPASACGGRTWRRCCLPAAKHLMKASAALARSLNLVRPAGSQHGGAAKSPLPFRPPQAGRHCRRFQNRIRVC